MKKCVMLVLTVVVLNILFVVDAAVTTHLKLDCQINDGMEVCGTTEIACFCIDLNVSLVINGVEVVSDSKSGLYEWSPQSPGTYELTHRTGNATFSRKVVYRGDDDDKELEIGWLDEPISNVFPKIYKSIKKVTIAPTVTKLPENAFAGCNGLCLDKTEGVVVCGGCVLGVNGLCPEKVVIPDGVRLIADGAFRNFSDMASISIPDSVKYIGDYAFAGDSYLDNVVLPESIESIGEGAFEDCSWMQTITMSGGVKKIGARAFAGCTKLAQIDVPERLTQIGDCAFSNCWRMTSASFPLALETVVSTAFTGCKALTGVTVPTHAGKMADWFAPVYTQIQTATVPEGETLVRNQMFKGCTALTTVAFADGGEEVVTIGDEAFSGCSKLTGFVFPDALETIGNSAFLNCSALRELIFGDLLQSIGDSAFRNCSALRELIFGDSLQSIGDSAFENCSGLNKIIMPNSLTRIGVSSFEGCYTIDELSLSTALEEIPSRAFYRTTGRMKEEYASGGYSYCNAIIVPESVKVVGDDAFSWPSSRIYYMGDAPDYSNEVYRGFSGTSYVIYGTKGWDGRPTSRDLPQSWPVDNTWSRPITTWEPNRFDVTFDAAGGQFESSGKSTCVVQETTSAGYVLPTETPVRSGYRFNGWWDSASGGARLGSVLATKAHTVYAQWTLIPEAEKLTIRLDANGGTVSLASIERNKGMKFGTLPVPVRDHYAFKGWWTESDGGTEVTESTRVSKSVKTIYARWKYAEYEILFHADDGTGNSEIQYFVLGDTVALRQSVFTRHGYELTGWATRSGGPVVYEEGQAVREFDTRVDKTVDLYAVWTRIGYWISYNRNGGQGWMDDQYAYVGETVALDACAFTRTGYSFSGWATTSSGRVAYADEAEVVDLSETKNATVELFAVWKKRGDVCTVTFDANGGSEVESREVTKGEAIGTLPPAVLQGYSLEGWYTKKSGGTKVTATTKVTADVTYYAHWKKLDTKGAWSGEAVVVTPGTTLKTADLILVPAYDPESGFDYESGVYYFTFTLKRGQGCWVYAFSDRTGEEYEGAYIDEIYCLNDVDAPSFDGEYSNVVSPEDWNDYSAQSATYVVRIVGEVGEQCEFGYKLFNGFIPLFLDGNGGKIYWSECYEETVETSVERDAAIGSGLFSYVKAARHGYTFDGWYTARTGGKKITEKTVVSTESTFYAHWKASGPLGDCPSAAVSLTPGSQVKDVSQKLVVRYDEDCDEYESEEGAYYYAVTLNRGAGCMFYLTYEGSDCDEDGDCYDMPYICCIESYGDEGGPSFEGEGFWTLSPEAWEEYGSDSVTYVVHVCGSIGQSFTLHYKLYNGSSLLTLDCQGGKLSWDENDSWEEYELGVERNVQISQGFLDFYKPKREKYIFDGWFTAPTGGQKITAKSSISEDTTWYAHWTYDGSAYVGVEVSDECEGMGTVTGGNKSFKSGAKVSLKATAKKGYVFAGWYDESGEPLAGTVDYRTPSYTYIATGEEDATIYAKFIATEDDWVSVDCAAEEEYAKGETMTPIEIAVDSGSLATVKVTGLPTGMKFTAKALSVKATKTTDAAEYAANTIYGKPSKSGVYTATVTATTAGKAKTTKTLKFIVRGEGECIVDANVVLTDAIGTIASTEDVPGKVTGMGVYATNKKVTLKATANRGYVFIGWYEYDDLVSRLASHVLTMPDSDIALEARFITAETDRAAISASVGDEFWFDAESTTAEKTISAGVYLEWPVAAEALSATTIKVTGLPTGLKFTTQPVTTKTTTGSGRSKVTTVVTNVPANTIYGTPSAASKTDKNGNVVSSAVKITVTTAGKNSQTFQIDTTVVALPEQVVGTFTGGSCDDPSGSATLTVAASGKVSGKWISDGKTWTLAATGFTSGEPDGDQFDTKLTAKCGKETQEIPLTVTSDGVASCDLFSAYWANWKIEPWKTLGKEMANKKYTFYIDADGNTFEDAIDSPYGTVTLTMSANGTVKTAGSFVTGTNAKTGKDIVYKASGSTTLIPQGEATYLAFVYFPQKGAFAGYANTLTLNWDGSSFSAPVARTDNWRRAASIAIGQTKSVSLVAEYDEGEYYDSGVCYLKFTAKRGQAYSVRMFDGDGEISTSVADVSSYDWDLEIWAPSFSRGKTTSSGTYFVLNSDDWDDDCPESVVYYIRLNGDIGQQAKVQLLPYAYEPPVYTVTFDANGGECSFNDQLDSDGFSPCGVNPSSFALAA